MQDAAQPRKMKLFSAPSRFALTGRPTHQGKDHMDSTTSSTPEHMSKATTTADVVATTPAVASKADATLSPSDSKTTSSQSHTPPTPKKKKKSFFSRTWVRIVAVLLLLLVITGAGLAFAGRQTIIVALELKGQADETEQIARGAFDKFKAQDLPGAQAGVVEVKGKIAEMRQTYEKLSYLKNIPLTSGYYEDGIHAFTAADAGVDAAIKGLASINQYADVLGFTGEGTFTGGTAEDRLRLMLQTLAKITPELDAIGDDLDRFQSELAQIDPKRYPEEFQGRKIREQIEAAQVLSTGAATALNEFRPVIERIPIAAGSDGKRKKYLVLFQNDNELRPTGGFLTAYSVIFVENGKVTPEKSDDIYELDKKFTKKLPIPPVLGKYLTTETKWNMRDMNTSPDFVVSMDQFVTNYKNVPGEPRDIDGVIAVDTQVLVDLLKVLGPIQVPGYGTFSAENDPKCDCPQIILALSEIITRPTPYLREDRKGILGPMMGAILQKAYSAPKTQWPDLFAAAWKNIEGRHAQVYFFDPETQAAAEKINASGRLVLDPNAQDFIAVINANLGGAKSNLFITYTMDQVVSAPSNGVIDKSVTITYKNSRKADNCNLEAGLLCLNSRLRDWTRIYTPKGSVLKSAQGFREGTAKTYDEGEFTVIEGEFFLDPLSQAKIQLEYTVPYTDTKEYALRLWKQGGISPVPVMMDVNGSQEEVVMDKDKTYRVAF